MNFKKLQTGATLIEVLVTMVVVAIGLFGAAGLQLSSLRYDQTAKYRTQAIVQLNQIRERMSTNVDGVLGGAYLIPNAYGAAGTLAADPGCGLGAQPDCTAALAAQRDLRDWQRDLARELPGGRGALHAVTTDPSAREVVVMWNEKADSDNTGVATTDPACKAPRVDGVRCLVIAVTP